MSLFEDWFITIRPNLTIRSCSGDDVYEELRRDELGEYYYTEVYWMHKAFIAGQILHKEYRK